LEDKSLHICFRKSPDGDTAHALFEQGLGTIDLNQTIEEALRSFKK
jgi:hypothetical protein